MHAAGGYNINGKEDHTMILGGKVHAAVGMVISRDNGGAYCPFDLDTKSSHPVIKVLRAKHPNCHVPSEEDFNDHSGAPNCIESMPVYCFEECIAKAAAQLLGSAGPCSVEADILKNWLLWHGTQS